MHGSMCIFVENVACIQSVAVDYLASADVYVNRCFDISIHICVHARCRVCTCAHVCAVSSFSVGGRGWRGSASLLLHMLLGVGVYF